MEMLSGVQKHVNCFDQGIKRFARYFQREADNRLYSFNLRHDFTVGITYKVNLITYFSCAYPQHSGGEGKGVRKGRGLGLTPPLSLIFYENFITCVNEINCFRILFAC